MANNYKYIGHNYTTPDLVAKVTGQGALRRGLSRRGHAVRQAAAQPDAARARASASTTSAALAHPRREGDPARQRLPGAAAAAGAARPAGAAAAAAAAEIALTDEPVYQGEPILAIAAVDESTAAEAIELLNVDYEPLPFCVDPLDSLRPGGPNARTQGNVYTGAGPTLKVVDLKWTDGDFAEAADGRLPMGEAPDTFVVRRPRGRLQGRRPDPRRDHPVAGHRPPAARDAHGDGLLAERQAVPARLHAERRADGAERRPHGRPQAAKRSSSSASTPAAASAARFPARTAWRFRRCWPRRPARR